MPPRANCGWGEGNVVAEGLQAGDEAFGEAFGVAALVIVAAEFAVGLADAQELVDRMPGDRRPPVSSQALNQAKDSGYRLRMRNLPGPFVC